MLPRQIGLLVLFALTSLGIDYLDREHTLISHGSGLLYGFIGGFLFGPILSPRKRTTSMLNLALGAVGCVGLIFHTTAWVENCAGPTVLLLSRYEAALDEERDLSERFEDALREWEHRTMSRTEFRALLKTQLIPRLEKLRTKRNLGMPQKFADMEKERLSLYRLLEAARLSKDRGAGKTSGCRRRQSSMTGCGSA